MEAENEHSTVGSPSGGQIRRSDTSPQNVEIFVAGEARPEPRPIGGRAFAKGDRQRKRPTGRVILRRNPIADPWKVSVRRAAMTALGLHFEPREPVFAQGTPVALGLRIVLPRPASVRRPLPCVLPDLDNYIKAIKDALGPWDDRPPILWFDDGQVVTYDPAPWKTYAAPGQAVGVHIRARAVVGDAPPW